MSKTMVLLVAVLALAVALRVFGLTRNGASISGGTTDGGHSHSVSSGKFGLDFGAGVRV